jgi:tetratricopeptide (TPR) repeat protein
MQGQSLQGLRDDVHDASGADGEEVLRGLSPDRSNTGPTPPESDLRERFAGGVALEDFTRFVDSLEVRIGWAYWKKRGGQAFINREVPNDITNDGVRASRAAEVLFANCEEAEDSGRLGDTIPVVEMGVGLGLFARLLLQCFRILCEQSGRDFHRRLLYHATDFSRQNLADIQRLGTLAEFDPRVRLGILDALDPTTFTPLGSGTSEPLAGPLRAVFHNYLFDALPQSLVLRQQGAWYELRVQTRLGEPWRLCEFTPRPFDEVMDLLRRGDPEGIEALSDAYPLIEVERSFFPVTRNELPYARFAERFADEVLQPDVDHRIGTKRNVRMWLPWGAMTSLEKTAERLAEDGFLLFTDYGHTTAPEVATARAYQRYGAGICIPVNFPILDGFAQSIGLRLIVAEGDETLPLHARLVTKRPLARTETGFARRFVGRDFHELENLLKGAREAADGDVARAQARFREAETKFPDNWLLLAEWAHVENFVADNPGRALELADRALALNPTCSADLWCERGDALHRLGDGEGSERAYLRGLEVNPEHSRSHFNIAWLRAERGAYGEALLEIGKALACDSGGHHTKMLLDKQQEILDNRAAARDADRQRLMPRGF